jgi:hypothetical protein
MASVAPWTVRSTVLVSAEMWTMECARSACSKPERGVRGQLGAILVEHDRSAEGHQRQRDVDDVVPAVHEADAVDLNAREGLLPVPLEPAAPLGTATLEHQVATRAQHLPHRFQSEESLIVFKEDLRNVPDHGREIDVQWREIGRHTVDPCDLVGSVLPSGNREHGCRRVDACDLEVFGCESAGERASAAAEVENRSSAEFAGNRQVDVQVTAIRVEIVVDRRQPRLLEDHVGTNAIVPRGAQVRHQLARGQCNGFGGRS